MNDHYLKTKLVKMGKWAHPPLDAETWHGVNTSRYFKSLFGIRKGLLMVFTLDSVAYGYPCAPVDYFRRLYRQIDSINSRDYRSLEKKLKTFYALLPQAKKTLAMADIRRYPKLKNKELAKIYTLIIDRVQHLTIFDQFGWLAEDYWTPKMEHILASKLGLEKGSPAYNSTLFSLTKPEEISTTLSEKRDVCQEAFRIKKGKSTLPKSAGKLAKKYGWMPIFTYGNPWTQEHYEDELIESLKRTGKNLEAEYLRLKNYSKLRKREIAALVKKFKISPRDLQVFVEFGLAMDTRNEAEYFVSFAGQYVSPLYREAAKRLYVSINQVRNFTQEELVMALLGKLEGQTLAEKKGKFLAWGFDAGMKKRTDYSSKEAEKLFRYIDAKAKYVQGESEDKGLCASSGKAVGRIRVVPTPEQNHKVQDGDILIAYATTTDYLPAMKRASAIVTEVGGLTCHAAVVSREFDIPCIVALKNAMSNFKDGELVEVNADSGTIKRLNNGKK